MTRRWLAGLILAALAWGCGGGGGTQAPGATAGSSGAAPSQSSGPLGSGEPGTSPASSAGASAGPSAGAGEFLNPVIDANFADPFILSAGGRYYAYATGNLTYNIQVAVSDDLVTWERSREALRNLPLWQPTSKGLTWAPEVVETSAGFVMHYTARLVSEGKQCLAVAVAESPEGPFVDDSDAPLYCQLDLGGSIDSSPFVDADGTRYLLWKNDGNCCGIRTTIFIAPLSDDGLTLAGDPVETGLAVDAPWERTLIEAPTLWLDAGTYYLFFSSNDYNSRNYAVGYATAETVLGPYTDAPNNPIVATSDPAAGPGHQSVVEDADGDLWMAYHAWDSKLVGDFLGGRRALWLDELVLDGGTATVDGPEVGPQPVP